MESEKKNSSPNNIECRWLERLSKETNPKTFRSIKNITKISFKLFNNELQKVLINEEENWFVLRSQKEIIINQDINQDDLIMELCSKVPIGFFDIKEGSEPSKKKLIYKSHQRFIKNDDNINIIRTIDLHLRDHMQLFFRPLSVYSPAEKNLKLAFETNFNSY